jgi:hypothetical protein
LRQGGSQVSWVPTAGIHKLPLGMSGL